MKFALKIPILSHWMFEKLIKFTTQIYTLNVYKANEYEVKIKIQKEQKKVIFVIIFCSQISLHVAECQSTYCGFRVDK